MAMHQDYAKECLERMRTDRFASKNADYQCIRALALEDELKALCANSAEEKIRDIASRPRKAFTQAMLTALATWLHAEYGSAQAVLAAAFNTSEEAMFGNVSPSTCKAAPSVDVGVANARSAHSKDAAAKAKFMGLPALKGSEKQVQWAESIRAAFISNNGVAPDPDGPGVLCPGDAMFGTIWGNDDIESVLHSKNAEKASFWIDNRSYVEMPQKIIARNSPLRSETIKRGSSHIEIARRIVGQWKRPDGARPLLSYIDEVKEVIASARGNARVLQGFIAQAGRMLDGDVAIFLEKNPGEQGCERDFESHPGVGTTFHYLQIHKNADHADVLRDSRRCTYSAEMIRDIIDELDR
ncbi:hypothetical protein LH427_13770 [Laribacter hongkongensis]|uniref:hypothetical protein n=1 Tax=Laribacter hongkongensis TaxID=168471 RepID=UPI001EFE7074|nr:hypothetical protein [Laribacter hongkongensis]MCG9062968.1 hypothetical protein [Laribacter hongkongensis]